MSHARSLWFEPSRHKDGASLKFSVRHVATTMLLAACAHFPSVPQGPAEYWGFTGPWDKRSDVSVERHGSNLARVITGWIALDTTSFLPVQLYQDSIGREPALAARAMALITSYNGSRFHPEIVRGLGGDTQAT